MAPRALTPGAVKERGCSNYRSFGATGRAAFCAAIHPNSGAPHSSRASGESHPSAGRVLLDASTAFGFRACIAGGKGGAAPVAIGARVEQGKGRWHGGAVAGSRDALHGRRGVLRAPPTPGGGEPADAEGRQSRTTISGLEPFCWGPLGCRRQIDPHPTAARPSALEALPSAARRTSLKPIRHIGPCSACRIGHH
jgi:hypothetical protein